MGSSFFANLQLLEILAFFSGYPLLYTIIYFIAEKQKKNGITKSRLILLLPYTYAMLGSLYIGLQLKNFYPDYSINHIKQIIHQPFLMGWGLLSTIFWIPALRKKTWLSLLHSLVFLRILIIDLFILTPQLAGDNSPIKNEMKMYTGSLILSFVAYSFIGMVYFVITKYSKRKSQG